MLLFTTGSSSTSARLLFLAALESALLMARLESAPESPPLADTEGPFTGLAGVGRLGNVAASTSLDGGIDSAVDDGGGRGLSLLVECCDEGAEDDDDDEDLTDLCGL